jgi:uncharacterized protein (TIGR03435 family)
VGKRIQLAVLASSLLVTVHGQTPGKAEFEVASIKINPPQTGFHLAADAASGGPGTADPAMFRCSKCSLATLIVKAFNLQPYQFPARTSLTDNTYDIAAKVPAGATGEEFSAMLQNLLRDRFGLTWHFEEKKMKGYHLVIAKNGPKLSESSRESTDTAHPAATDHNSGRPESHNHSGVVSFGSMASYRAVNQTAADLVRVLSDQIGLPVDDETGLTGKYDISIRWSGTATAHAGNHSDGAFSGGALSGGAWHGHDGGAGAASRPDADSSGPTLFDALQQQLGLRLVAAEQSLARVFVIDHVAQQPTAN